MRQSDTTNPQLGGSTVPSEQEGQKVPNIQAPAEGAPYSSWASAEVRGGFSLGSSQGKSEDRGLQYRGGNSAFKR